MKKKLLIIASASAIALGGITAFGLGSNGSLTGAKPEHTSDHTAIANVFDWKDPTKEGFKPYYMCSECCLPDADARYSDQAMTKKITLDDVRYAPMTAATVSDVGEGDQIKNVIDTKYKYIDQGPNGATGNEKKDDVETAGTTYYVKDGEKTAIYFSRSGLTPRTGSQNTESSEFRFTAPSKKVTSVSFSYRYENYSDATWNYGTNTAAKDTSEPATAWSALAQFKDGNYYGTAMDLVNDGAWHTIKVDYADARSSVDATSDLSVFILKFVDLSGYIMISDLKFEEAPVTVTLKNIGNTDGSEKVAIGSLPTTIPTLEGKKFLGWYDADGNKVTAVTASTTELIARWAIAKYSADNPVYRDISNTTAKDYGTVDGVDVSYGFWQADGDNMKFSCSTGGENNKSAGIALPVIDFSSISGVYFTFGFGSGVWNGYDGDNYYGVSLDGKPVGPQSDNSSHSANYEVWIKGKKVSVHNELEKKDYSFELSEETYTGKKGLAIQTGRCYEAPLLISKKFISYDYDYLAGEAKIEAALPDTPAAGYSDQINDYNELRAAYTDYEKTADPISEKMRNWIDKYTVATLADFTKNNGITITNTDDSHKAEAAESNYTDGQNKAKGAVDAKDACVWCGNLVNAASAFTLPAINYSSYTKAEFTIGFANNVGQDGGRYLYLGNVVTSFDKENPTTDTNYIGQAKQPNSADYWADAYDVTVTISNGSISFKSASIDKSFTLDADINNGTTGLTITFAELCWEYLVISPVLGYKI
jgi:hypothetical protein